MSDLRKLMLRALLLVARAGHDFGFDLVYAYTDWFLPRCQ